MEPWNPEGWNATERRYKMLVSGDSDSSDDDDDDDDDAVVTTPRTHRPPPKYKKLVQREDYVPDG